MQVELVLTDDGRGRVDVGLRRLGARGLALCRRCTLADRCVPCEILRLRLRDRRLRGGNVALVLRDVRAIGVDGALGDVALCEQRRIARLGFLRKHECGLRLRHVGFGRSDRGRIGSGGRARHVNARGRTVCARCSLRYLGARLCERGLGLLELGLKRARIEASENLPCFTLLL